MLTISAINAKSNSLDDELEIIRGTGERLEDVSSTGKVRPWNQKKQDSLRLADLYRYARAFEPSIITDGQLVRLELCADLLQFNLLSDGSKRLKSAHFCRNRFCPMCTWRKSLKTYFQTDSVVSAILADKPKERFLFLTLTIRNVSSADLSQTLDRLNKAWSKIFSYRDRKRYYVDGAMKALEITYNSQTDTYHPHIHAILAVPPTYFKHHYIKQEEWRDIWQKALDVDYLPQVNIQAIKTTTSKAVAEVAKYPVKMSKLFELARNNKRKAAKVLITLTKACRNRRFVSFIGIFKSYRQRLKQDDIETGDLIHVEQDTNASDVVAIVFHHFRASIGVYVC